tara:strand:- start:191 stop:781 length:591 start_codon:yes stop_codon:yes gene_type:complete
MPLLSTELLVGDVHTISIPTDAILIVSLLILFVLLGYCFNNLLSNQTNQFAQKKDIDSNLKLVKKNLEDQFRYEENILDEKKEKKTITKKLNFLPPSKLLRLGSLAVLAMGGTSLLGWHYMQKSYESAKTSQSNIKLVNQSIKSTLSIMDSPALNKAQSNVQKISYIDPFLCTIKSSKENNYYQFKKKEIESNFSF